MRVCDLEAGFTKESTVKQVSESWLLLYEASTRIVLTLPEEMKMKLSEFRDLIRVVASYFKDYKELDTDQFYLIASKYSRDFKKYSDQGSVNVLKMIGNQRIFIVKREATA